MAGIDTSAVPRRATIHLRRLLALVVVLLILAGTALFFWRDALWMVAGACVADQRLTGHAFPCTAVDDRRGTVLIHLTRFHALLVPARRLTGLESAPLTAATAENYFADAWEARAALDASAGHPLAANLIGLAVNSAAARTQDQLHIHIGCLRSDVLAALAKVVAGTETAGWRPSTLTLTRRRYAILVLPQATLAGANPFALLAAGLPQLGGDMAEQTLVVAGLTLKDGSPGFALLASRSGPDDPAIGEKLLDYQCRVGR